MTTSEAPTAGRTHMHGAGLDHETRSMETRSRTDETKHATKTSEFWLYVGLVVGLIVASAVASGFGPNRFWLFATILTGAYLLSRGFAKALRGRGTGNETKPSFKTTELWIYAVALLGLFITGLATESGDFGESDTLPADRVWLYAALLTATYLVSRGLAKSGAGAQASHDHGPGLPLGDRVKAAAEALSGGDGGSRASGHRTDRGI